MKNVSPEIVDVGEALLRLQRLCAKQEKCLADVRRKMRSWNLSRLEMEEVERQLLAGKFVDEARYAAAFARERAKFSHWGVLKIRAALHAKKIDDELIDSALREVDGNQQRSDLLKDLQKKAQTLRAKSPHDLSAKLMRFGLSRGYEHEEVREAVRKLHDAYPPNATS
ncbi:MAG: RecX family transcriptional regulator [Prevotellaceae bacterium]|jgi:regulatory protein|nr:RecX family transcriptional regulator [Prevotellaceae bacterium]